MGEALQSNANLTFWNRLRSRHNNVRKNGNGFRSLNYDGGRKRRWRGRRDRRGCGGFRLNHNCMFYDLWFFIQIHADDRRTHQENEKCQNLGFAHARRKFVDAEKTHPAIASEAVGWIKRLYAVEERGKALDVAARTALRQQESTQILSSLRDRLFAWHDQLLPRHPMRSGGLHVEPVE
jgi:hypothetical protein